MISEKHSMTKEKKTSTRKIDKASGLVKGEFWVQSSIDDGSVKKLISENKLTKHLKRLAAEPSRMVLKDLLGTALAILEEKEKGHVDLMLLINQSLITTEELMKDAQYLAKDRWPGAVFQTKIKNIGENWLSYKNALKRAGWIEKNTAKGITTLEFRL
jgi:hypothetical protein